MKQQAPLSPKILGAAIGGVGLIIALVFALADVLAIGQHPERFGTGQTIGTVTGILLLAIGAVIFFFGEPPPAHS